MIIVLLGAPGSGKGTQARFLKEHFDLPTIGMGELLRGEVEKETEIGLQIKGAMDAGHFPPDEFAIRVLKEHIKGFTKNHFILDGFPRSLIQAHALEGLLKDHGWGLDAVILLDVDRDILVERLSVRYQCTQCGAPYSKALDTQGVCAWCGGTEFTQRRDDRPDIIRERLNINRERIDRLVSFYEEKKLLKRFNGEAPPDVVSAQLREWLQQKIKGKTEG